MVTTMRKRKAESRAAVHRGLVVDTLPPPVPVVDDPDAWGNTIRAEDFSRETGAEGLGARGEGRDDDVPDDGYAAAGQVVRIGLDLVHPHPANRRPTPAAIEQLAASFADPAARQLQPILVRVPPPHWGLAEGHVQIVFGERRYRAAMLAGWESIEARIRTDLSDAEALELMAEENAKREDLNPIDRARLVESLCKPIDQCGAGLTREKAAQRVGLESGSAASNLVRLLELPTVWQERVAAGELPESFARLLLPYCVAPGLMAAIDADYRESHKGKQSEWKRERWESRRRLEDHLRSLVSDWARPIDGKKEIRCYDYKQTGTYRSEPRLFKLTEEVRATLDVVTIPIDGKPCEVAGNTKAFDKLQLPLVKAKHGQKGTGSGGRGTGKSKDQHAACGPKEPTAKQLEREREKAREERAENIAVWRLNWMMAEVNDAIAEGGNGPGQRLLVFLAAQGIDDFIGDETEGALRELAKRHRIDAPRGKRDFTYSGNTQLWALIKALPGEALNDAMRAILRGVLLSPARHLSTAALAPPIVEDLAREAGVDLAWAWHGLQCDRNQKGSRFNQFLDLWPGDSLDELGEECGLYLANVRGRAAKLKLLLSKCPNLPLPKSIAPLAAKAESGKRKAGKAKGGR